VTEIEQLRSRKELVVLAAELQRATIVRRLERIEANPARKFLSAAAGALRRPALLSVATAAVKYLVRAYRRKRLARRPAY
jgi:hypothetical protein